MPLVKLTDVTLREPLPGFRGRFVHSDSMTMAYWDIAGGSELPAHAHPHEQIVNVVDGQLEMVCGGETHLLDSGSVLVIPSNVPHSARAVTDCRVIDAFQPVREDYR